MKREEGSGKNIWWKESLEKENKRKTGRAI